ncbi:MAG: hypothetical protein WBD10_07595 [Acidobacteriaceae bacterium]
MAILLIIAALILIGVIVLLVKKSGTGNRGRTVPDRFKDVGPGEPRPKGPRASGLD